MTYKQFQKDVEKTLKENFPDYTIKSHHYQKSNKETDGICVAKESGVALTFDLELFYSQKLSMEDIVEVVNDCLHEMSDEVECSVQEIANQIKNGNTSKIIPALLNKELNQKIIGTCPYKEWLDFLIVYKCVTEDFSVLIDNQMLDLFKLTKQELHQIAMDNLTVCISPSFFSLTMMTNKESNCGASVILKTNELDKLADYYGCDLYLIPSSIHEFIMIPVAAVDNINHIKQSIFEVNKEAVKPHEFLSNNLYIYHKQTKRISIVR